MAVLGLNPHSGEEGLLGDEEKREILPAIAEAKLFGMDAEGPFPADSFFNMSSRHAFDAVIAMYHDQGLIPIKMIDFREAVNFTLGLPFIRTSVDHGQLMTLLEKDWPIQPISLKPSLLQLTLRNQKKIIRISNRKKSIDKRNILS